MNLVNKLFENKMASCHAFQLYNYYDMKDNLAEIRDLLKQFAIKNINLQ